MPIEVVEVRGPDDPRLDALLEGRRAVDAWLDPGDPEPHTCSYTVDVNSSMRARPVLLGHPGPGTKQFSLQAGFTAPSTPRRIWWFATEDELSATMPGDGHEMEPAAGRYRREFDALVPGWCYGFAWQW